MTRRPEIFRPPSFVMGIVIVERGGSKELFQDGPWRISTHAL
jgi:hypothetical protein